MVTDILTRLSTNPAAALPALFIGGVLTSMTPCIYPMIPITAAVIGGQSVDTSLSKRRRILLTAAYVLGLSLVYALLGLIAGMSGSMFGAVSSSPWTSLLLANLLILFALMMLDVIAVPVPQRLLARAAALHGGGRVAATFGMGAASGLVVAPCGAPVMGAVLGWVAATQQGALGFVYLFVFSLGMSVFLVVIGLSAGAMAALPRAGAWMIRAKRIFAVIMLGVAEYYLITLGRYL
ncbi:MAG: cytochrome c biogenesis protein CcdA [Longimicrobiales bacterium]